MRKGDMIAKVAKPVAMTFDYWLGTNLQSCRSCEQMRENLNAGMSLADACYDRFFRKPKQQKDN